MSPLPQLLVLVLSLSLLPSPALSDSDKSKPKLLKYTQGKGSDRLISKLKPKIREYTQGKLSFQYPESLGTDFSRPFSWPPSVKLVRASTCQCDTVINGQRYCIEQWSEGSAGHIEMTYTYLTELPKHKVAVSVAVMVRTPQCMNYDEPQQSRCITERDSFDLNQLIHALVDSIDIA